VKVRRTSSRDLDHGQRIILEEIRLGGRAVRESIEAMRMALEARLDQLVRDSRVRDAALLAAAPSAHFSDRTSPVRYGRGRRHDT
jgi:hypothetical protein